MTRLRRASLVWTRPALDSLLDVTRYIQADKPAAARRFAAGIKAKVGRLQSFPQSGRVVPEFPTHGLREVIVADYRIVYRFMKSQNTVQILAVHHGARLLDKPPKDQ